MTTTRKSIVFLALTFTLSWAVAIAGWALGLHETPFAALMLTLMMAGPAIAALICVFAFEKGARRKALGLVWTPNIWWLAAWAIAIVLGALSVALTVLLSDRQFADVGAVIINTAEAAGSPQAASLREVPYFGLLVILGSAILGALINAPILTLTEELGWRGYLHHLWRPSGFWRASLATGAVWGLWHAPAILLYGLNYPQNREIGIGLFIVWCTLMGPLMTFVRDKGRSVIAPGITHGAVNAIAGLTIASLSNPAFPWTGLVGIGGFLALILLVAAVAALRRGAPDLAPGGAVA